MTMPAAAARQFGRVALVYGGDSAERDVSLDSGAGVLAALKRLEVDVVACDGIPALLERCTQGDIDRVFNILHGRGGEDGVLQGALDAIGVPYTGSGVLGSALAMDKVRSKALFRDAGLPTPADRAIDGTGDVAAAIAALGLPVVVKPAHEGSSVGISRVFEPEDIDAAVALARRYDGLLLIERLIDGPEFTVAIVDGLELPSIQIVSAGAYYDYHAKYVAEDTTYRCPALTGVAEASLQALARSAFDVLGCSGWGRVDLMRDQAGQWQLLEVNTAPGMTSHSLVPKAAAAIGIDYETLVARILASAGGACP